MPVVDRSLVEVVRRKMTVEQDLSRILIAGPEGEHHILLVDRAVVHHSHLAVPEAVRHSHPAAEEVPRSLRLRCHRKAAAAHIRSAVRIRLAAQEGALRSHLHRLNRKSIDSTCLVSSAYVTTSMRFRWTPFAPLR